MTEEISKLREQIAQTSPNRRGRRRFGREIRAEVVRVGRAWILSGGSRSELSKKLGISDGTLSKWLRSPSRVRPVAVEVRHEDAGGKAAAILEERPLSVTLPSGVRIDGLSAGQIASVLQSLS